MFQFQEDISKQINRVNARTRTTREELFRRVLNAKEFMHDSWQSDLSLNTVAQQACLSPYHFHRSFQEAFGQSPMKWFRHLKLSYAKDLLASGKMNVTEVALNIGFADVFSFSKAFKRELGVSPSKLRD
ncbi:MAG: AraC family transcriptional regulator [Saprospiraceae bacterium]